MSMSSAAFAEETHKSAVEFFGADPEVAVITIDDEHTIRGFSSKAAAIWGVSPSQVDSEVIGNSVNRVLVPRGVSSRHLSYVQDVIDEAAAAGAQAQFYSMKSMGPGAVPINHFHGADTRVNIKFRAYVNRVGEVAVVAIAQEAGKEIEDLDLTNKMEGFTGVMKDALDPNAVQNFNTQLQQLLKAYGTVIATIGGVGAASIAALSSIFGFNPIDLIKQEPLPERPQDIEVEPVEASAYYLALQMIFEDYDLIRIFTGRVGEDRQGRFAHYNASEQIVADSYELFLSDVRIVSGSFFDRRYTIHRRGGCTTTITSEMTDLEAKLLFERSEVVAQVACGYGDVFVGAELDTEDIPEGLEDALRQLAPP